MHDPESATNESTPRRANILIEERRLLSRWLRNHARCFYAPKPAEQIDRPRTEPRVVVIGKCQNHDAPLMDLLEKTDPLGKITVAIYNHLVPSCRFFLDPFPVSQPANVSEVGGNQVEFALHLPGPRHPALINQRESDAVLSQHVREFRNQPVLVANLDGKLVLLRKPFQKRN